MEAPIYNAGGKKTGSIVLPESIFDVAWNDSLIHQVVTSMLDNARTPVAHTKGRGEVRGGGRKPWRQKGTGRARHGSIRSPIWKGGGVTHGPIKDKVFARSIPQKMRAKALFMTLSRKVRDGEVLFVDSFQIDKPSTATAKKILTALSTKEFEKISSKKQNAALVAFSDPTPESIKSFRNIGNVAYSAVRNLNPVTVLKHSYLIVENPEAAIAILSQRVSKSAAAKEAAKTAKVAKAAKAEKPAPKKRTPRAAKKTK
jgi:large subunit ribosomal protein L4